MAATKISDLTAATSLDGTEALPIAKSGANARVTPAQIGLYLANTAPSYDVRAKPLNIVYFGDSLAELIAQANLSSPLFWSQVRDPRVFNQEFVSAEQGGPGSLSSYVTQTAQVNAVKALNPDIVFYVTGMNDQNAAVDFTATNVKSSIDLVGAPLNIIMPVTPNTRTGTGTGSYQSQVARYKRLAQDRRDVLAYAGPHALMLDDTTAYSPIGLAAGGAGAMTVDGVHYSTVFGRAAEPSFSKLLDTVRAPRWDLVPISSGGNYNASTAPTGNLVTNGYMSGSTGLALFGPSTGVTATNWGNSSGQSAGLTTVYSKSTISRLGATHTAGQIAVSSAAPLGSNTTVGLRSTSGIAVPNVGGAPVPLFVQALLEVTNPTDVGDIGLQVQYTKGGVVQNVILGGVYNGTFNASTRLTFSGTEVWTMVFPGYLLADAGTGVTIGLLLNFTAGTQPSVTVKLGQVGIFPGIPL